MKSRLIGKELGKTESRRRTEWQRIRRLNGIIDSTKYEFEQTPGDSEGQGSLVRCSPWGHKESDMNNTREVEGERTDLGTR